MAELSLNDYGRAASSAIAAWKRQMEQSGKKLDGACQEVMKLEKMKAPTAEEAKKLKECTRLRDGIHDFIVAESKKLDSTLRSFKLKKDTDLAQLGSLQGKLESLVGNGLGGKNLSLTFKLPKSLNLIETQLQVKGKFQIRGPR